MWSVFKIKKKIQANKKETVMGGRMKIQERMSNLTIFPDRQKMKPEIQIMELTKTRAHFPPRL